MEKQNPKLRKLALLIAEDLDVESESIQYFFGQFRQYATERSEYFNKMNSLNFLLLFLMTWSVKVNGNLKLYDETIVPNLFFTTLFFLEDEHPTEDCDNCNGNGREECNYCDGTGSIECDDCDGTGTVTCSECDGEKEIEGKDGEMEKCDLCDGSGTEECYSCDGSGKVDCRDCNGGEDTCSECNGNGQIEATEKYLYRILFLVSWNKKLEAFSKNNVNNIKGISQEDFDNFYADVNNILELSESEDGAEVESDLEVDKYYCMKITDEPILGLNRNFTFRDDSRENYRILRDYYIVY